jgi:ABC-2 type transport system permease protein
VKSEKIMLKNFRIWLIYTGNSFQQTLVNRMAVGFLLTGKFLRIFLFLVFLNFLFNGTKGIAGYNKEQIIFFYLTFNLIDSLASMMFREVYRFRDLVVTGNLDLILIKPFNPLMRVLLGGADLLDLTILILIIITTIFYGMVSITTNPLNWILFTLLIINSLLIATAFHIFVLGMGIISTVVDHLVLVYRDFTSMLRIPVDLYIEPIRFILTFLIPLGIMMTFPAKVLMGILSSQFIFFAFVFSLLSIFLALRFWRYSIRYYSSASS